MTEPAMTIELRDAAAPAGDVAVANRSGSVVRLFNLSNSWGDDAWSFELERDGETRPVRRRPQAYTRDVPASRELPDGATGRWAFDLADGTWELGEADARGGARLTAVYAAPATPEAEELGVLTGPLRSPPVDLAD